MLNDSISLNYFYHLFHPRCDISQLLNHIEIILNKFSKSIEMISRNNSGPLSPKVGIENLCASLSQKDKIILILEKELQGFKSLRENYERLKDRKNQLMDKCQCLSRQISINRANQDVRADHSQKYIVELKMVITNLENDLQNKHYQLKELKCSAESLIKSSQHRQNDLLQSGQSIQEIKSSMEILKMESERLFNQISQLRDEIQRLRQYQKQTESAREKVKSQIHNTQTFIRQLGYEQSKVGENLSTLEDQNNSIDEIIQDLKKVYEMTKLKIRDVKEERQEITLKIKSKQLQKGRIQTEYHQRVKHFKSQREKEKSLKEVTELKRGEIQRVSTLLKEVEEESDELMKSNMQIQNINIQLQKDLHTCHKHLENVNRVNSSMKEKLEMFYKINVTVMKKLRKPVDEGWAELNCKRQTEMESTTEGFMDKSV